MSDEEDRLETVTLGGYQFNVPLVLHHYHCPLDGDQLIELPLGFLMCRKCRTQFISSKGHMDNEYELSWVEEKS